MRARAVSRPRLAQWGRRRGAQGGQVTVSEQRRPLLLPQEVKELGSEEALIFYEGLRPIRCRKLRYYQDRRFKQRLMPPPARPIAPDATLQPAAKEASVVASGAVGDGRSAEPLPSQAQSAAACSAPIAEAREERSPREPTLGDLPRLESLTLADFAGNYEHIPVLEDRTATEAEIEQAVEDFLADLNVPRERKTAKVLSNPPSGATGASARHALKRSQP